MRGEPGVGVVQPHRHAALAQPPREAEVVEVRVREHQRVDVAEPAAEDVQRPEEVRPGPGQSRVDDGQPPALLQRGTRW